MTARDPWRAYRRTRVWARAVDCARRYREETGGRTAYVYLGRGGSYHARRWNECGPKGGRLLLVVSATWQEFKVWREDAEAQATT
jgi:hypothetical protein